MSYQFTRTVLFSAPKFVNLTSVAELFYSLSLSTINAIHLSPQFRSTARSFLVKPDFLFMLLFVSFQLTQIVFIEYTRHELNRCFALRFAQYAIHLPPFLLNCAFMPSSYLTLWSFHLFKRIVNLSHFCELQWVVVSTITLSINIPQLLSFALLCVKCDNQFTWFI